MLNHLIMKILIRNGVTVVRICPGPSNKDSFSPKQLEQQAKFALMMKFLQPLTKLLNQTFRQTARAKTPCNKAFSYNLIHANTGTYPNLSIDYAMARLSLGYLNGFESAFCESCSTGEIVFTWIDRRFALTMAKPDDQVFLAAFDPESNHWYSGFGTVQRNVGSAILHVCSLKGKPLHTYLGLISADGKLVSNRVYTGMVTVC
jgi:hypothetical protein